MTEILREMCYMLKKKKKNHPDINNFLISTLGRGMNVNIFPADTIIHNLPALWCAVSASTSIRQGVCHRMQLLGFKSDDMKVNCWGPKSRLRTEVPSSQQCLGQPLII